MHKLISHLLIKLLVLFFVLFYLCTLYLLMSYKILEDGTKFGELNWLKSLLLTYILTAIYPGILTLLKSGLVVYVGHVRKPVGFGT